MACRIRAFMIKLTWLCCISMAIFLFLYPQLNIIPTAKNYKTSYKIDLSFLPAKITENKSSDSLSYHQNLTRNNRLIIAKGHLFFKNLPSDLGEILMCDDFSLNSELNFVGPIKVNKTLDKMDAIEKRFESILLPGGWYKPSECLPIERVAIIIPYRDRASQLPILLANRTHGLKCSAYSGVLRAIMNIGFVEALKIMDWDCFIFHDVDLLPLDDRILYTCSTDQPRHLAAGVDKFRFRLPYQWLIGGVAAMTPDQFKTVNGFSNIFLGWGGEDDDMSRRLEYFGYHIDRVPRAIGKYTMLRHPSGEMNQKRRELLNRNPQKFNFDGLNSLKYKIHHFEKKILYTWIYAEVEV